MGIMTRMINIFKADIHSVMDQLENREFMLKQHLRDMGEILARKDARLKRMLVSKSRMQHQQEKYRQQCQTLEQDLTAAIQKDKAQIARLLIRKLKPLKRMLDELDRTGRSLSAEIVSLQEGLEQQRMQYEQLRYRSLTYFRKSEMPPWESVLSPLAADETIAEMTAKEVDLELLRRKEALLASHT